MPMSVDCLSKKVGRRLTIAESLSLDRTERRELICVECHRRVIPHAAASTRTQAAHFQHLHRIRKCSRSDKRTF